LYRNEYSKALGQAARYSENVGECRRITWRVDMTEQEVKDRLAQAGLSFIKVTTSARHVTRWGHTRTNYYVRVYVSK
jgi:hypothetical protein